MRSHTLEIQAVYKTTLAFIFYLHKTLARGDLLSQVAPGHVHSFAHCATLWISRNMLELFRIPYGGLILQDFLIKSWPDSCLPQLKSQR